MSSIYRARTPDSAGLCSGKLLPRTMTRKASRGFPLVRRSRLSGIEPMTYSLRAHFATWMTCPVARLTWALPAIAVRWCAALDTVVVTQLVTHLPTLTGRAYANGDCQIAVALLTPSLAMAAFPDVYARSDGPKRTVSGGHPQH
jgi:hypothetical protein